MKVCAFGHNHKMHKKLKYKGCRGCHNGLKASEGPFEQGKCHFKKCKKAKKDKHHHGHKRQCHGHGHKSHGPKQLCLHPHGGKHFGLSFQNSSEGNLHNGHDGIHAHGGPHHGRCQRQCGLDRPHRGHGGPHHGHGGPFHGRGGPNNERGCGRVDFHKERHDKHHEHGEKRNKHKCQCFSQDQTGPQEPSRCLERPKSV